MTAAEGKTVGAAKRRRVWLLALGLSMGPAVATGYARFAYGLILPAMRRDLGWSYAQAGWINTANALGYFAGAWATLMLIRRIGPKPMFCGGMILTAAALLLSAVSRDLLALTVCRLLAGMGGAPAFIAGGALVSGLFHDEPRRNATAIALNFAGGGMGIVLSGLIVPNLLDLLGVEAWPMAWLALGVLAVISTGLALWAVGTGAAHFHAPPATTGQSAGRLPASRMWPSLAGYSLFAVGYIVYFTFVVAWMRANSLATFAVVSMWCALGIGAMVAPVAWRRILASFNSGVPLALACGLTGLATAVPLLMGGTAVFVFSAFLFGLSFFSAPSAITTFTRKNLDHSMWGHSVALYTTLFALGQAVGPLAAGLLTDLSGSLAWGLAAAAGVLLVAAGVSTLQRPLVR